MKPQPVKKIVRVKRGPLTAAALSSVSGRGGERGEGRAEEKGGGKEGREEEGGGKESQYNGADEQVENTLPAPSAKRRKLSRTTLAPAQATPTLAPPLPVAAASGPTNTTAVAMVTPQVVTTVEPVEPAATRPELNQTKPVQPSAEDRANSTRPAPAIDFTCIDRSKPLEEMESEGEASERPALPSAAAVGEGLGETKDVVREEQGEAGGGRKTEVDVERRMSVSEMKAQM